MKDEKEKLRMELVHTQFLENRQLWTAFVTWRGMDIQEFGETEAQARYFLIERHKKWFNLE